jgi:NitT/TauT family transport system substrate-binding protein
MSKSIRPWLLPFFAAIALLSSCSQPAPKLSKKIRLSVAPFQDTLIPIIGEKKGWYKEAGLDVEIVLLPWYNGQEALASGSVDIGMGNISSVIGAHHNAPNNVYAYGFDIFDNGFAIMVRPGKGLRTAAQFRADGKSAEEAARAAIRQLKGKTVITTGRTDMEQVVSYAVHDAGMTMFTDVKVLDLEPDEGLAAFLGGRGDAYLGGIPQRARALKEGHLELVSGQSLGPAEINGLVTTRRFANERGDDLVKLLNVIFRIIKHTNDNIDDSAQLIVQELNKNTAANFTIDDFKKYWNNYEHYTASAAQAQERILNPADPSYWKRRWDDTNSYFLNVAKSIPGPVDPKDVFIMESVHQRYLGMFGSSKP